MLNREIKFRAWDKRTRKMIDTGFHILGETTCFDLIYQYCMEHGKRKDECGLQRINSVVIMQYTGLKDRNGKEIYEGDILRGRSGFYPVSWDIEYASFMAVNNYAFINTSSWCKKEIIGNIYENPELLSGDSNAK